MAEVKYRHPKNNDLTWSGRGKQPAWVTHWINAVGPLEALEVARQEQARQQGGDAEIDLGIGDVAAPAAEPTLGESLYAQRIVAGHTAEPTADDPTFSEGTKTAVARIRDAEAKVISGEVTVGAPPTEQESRDLLNQLLGQAQAFSAASQLLQTFGVSKLAYVKENGLYKHLAGINTPNGLALRGTWEEFCSLLGMSDEKANQDIANLRAFGEEALESMSRMGIGYRELRQFRKLPSDQREALAQIAKSGNKDDVLEAAYDAIEKERASAQELQVKNAELSEDLKAVERRAKNLDAELERTHSQITRLSAAKKRTTEFLLRTEEIREECMALQLGAELNLNSLQKLFDEVRAEDPSLPEWRLQIEQVWVAAHVVAARALDMVERMKDGVRDGEMPERVMGQHILSPAEAQRWLLDYPMIENRHAADAAARQEKRDAAKPKGPGRPKGSSNKMAEE